MISKYTIKLILASLTISAFSFFLTGCYSGREMNDLAFTLCTGIDKSKNGYIVTHQILNASAIATNNPRFNESPVLVLSSSGEDLFETYRNHTTNLSRKIYNSHLKVLILGEDVAKDGIQKILDFYIRDHEFRTDYYIVIAKGSSAADIMKQLTYIDDIPAIKMYNSLNRAEQNWAPVKSVKITELVNTIIADGKNPVLPVIRLVRNSIEAENIDALKWTTGKDYTAYEGLSVFNKDRLVGWLDEKQSKAYNYITGNIKNTVGHLTLDKDIKITFETKAQSKIKATMVNDKPVIDVNIEINQNIAAVEGYFDTSKKENIDLLNEKTRDKLKFICEETITEAKKMESDIFGFGEAIHRKYPKKWKELKDDWDKHFKDLKVNINIKVVTDRTGLSSIPYFMKKKE